MHKETLKEDQIISSAARVHNKPTKNSISSLLNILTAFRSSLRAPTIQTHVRRTVPEISIESQKRAKEEHTRKQEKHEMEKELHKWDILLAETKVDGQQLRGLNRDIKESERLRAYMKSLKSA